MMFRFLLMVTFMAVFLPLQSAHADWPFFSNDGAPRRGTAEWYCQHASDPPGARQVCKHGKLWPPYPRPVGPHQTFWHKFHHAHYWPWPYTCEDRQSVIAFRDVQVINGWISQTTLYDYHFDPLTNELNSSGQDHLRWILVHVPEQYRQVYVAITNDPNSTGIRTANVSREVTRLAGADSGLHVATRLADPVGRPASEVQSIFKSALENMPPPVLGNLDDDSQQMNN